jgi:2-(1,2-epoxy-1,2-dihydrophenyl)acetyl-CoA isomerase
MSTVAPPPYALGMHTLLIERGGGVVTVTLNRPEKKNAINDTMWDELLETFLAIANNTSEDRVVVITGAGGAFCSGADIGGGRVEETNGLTSMRHVGDVCAALHALPQPVIAKVGGVAAGAGLNLALGCDLIVASDDARFSEIFARRGLSIDFGGSWVLPRLVGLHKAKELVLFADIIGAKEAQEIGIVNRVVPASELDAFVDDWSSRLAAGPPLALSMSKRLLDQSSAVSLAQALEAEALAQNVNFQSKDTAEAMIAFVQKREPRFEGR